MKKWICPVFGQRLVNKIIVSLLICLLLNSFTIPTYLQYVVAQMSLDVSKTIDKADYNYSNIEEQVKLIPNEYLLVIDNSSTSFTNEIQRNVNNFSLTSESFRINDYANFSTVSIKLPDKTIEGGPASVGNLSRNLTISDVETIFNIPHSGPASPMNIPANNSTEICLLILERSDVTSCEPNRTLPPPASTQTIPTGLTRIGGKDISPMGIDIGQAPFTVAVIDTGINPVPDLNLVGSISFEGNNHDNYKHGTHVAGILAAKNNNFGIIGVAPNAKLFSLKVYDTIRNPGQVEDFNRSFKHILDHPELGIKIINISYDIGTTSTYLEQATKALVAKGITIVAAAGNQNRNASLAWPGGDPNVISVAAISDKDGRCGGNGGILDVILPNGDILGHDNDDSFANDYSNWGPQVDLAAPGTNILSTWPDGTFRSSSGTSMASPYVAGAAAFVKFANSDATPQGIKNILRSQASLPSTICDGDGHGYFTGRGQGEPSTSTPIPLLYIKNIIR